MVNVIYMNQKYRYDQPFTIQYRFALLVELFTFCNTEHRNAVLVTTRKKTKCGPDGDSRLLDLIASGQVGLLAAFQLDEISTNKVTRAAIIDDLARHGGRLVTVWEQFDSRPWSDCGPPCKSSIRWWKRIVPTAAAWVRRHVV